MSIRHLSSPAELQHYDRWVKSHPQGTLWQSLEWKAYQEALGREVRIYVDGDPIAASALVVIDRTTLGFSTWDIPRGPLEKGQGPRARGSIFLQEILDFAKRERTLSLYFSPQDKFDHTSLDFAPLALGPSHRSEQPPATRLLDLRKTEEQILAQMKQKGRYNIRVAEKHGVQVRLSEDIDGFAHLAAETARRDGFTAPPASRYKIFLESLPGAFLLLASFPFPAVEPACPVGRGPGVGAIAGLLGTQWNGTGIYYYGASDYEYRNLMGPYLLQWEAMKLCKAKGCHTYDLLGISHPLPEQSSLSSEGERGQGMEGTSAGRSQGIEVHSWSGITRFKAQFGGKVVEYPPEQQIVLRPWTNRLLQWKRQHL